MPTTKNPTKRQQEQMRSYRARHLPGDAQSLADDLYRKASRGDDPARRMLAALRRRLTRWGARIPEPTWPPVWSPGRREELDS